eukprot:m.900310 g.900310  ORF g.900310 m.900310 type:complete len:379 (-) comp23685_c0_seq4:155-1291(-)
MNIWVRCSAQWHFIQLDTTSQGTRSSLTLVVLEFAAAGYIDALPGVGCTYRCTQSSASVRDRILIPTTIAGQVYSCGPGSGTAGAFNLSISDHQALVCNLQVNITTGLGSSLLPTPCNETSTSAASTSAPSVPVTSDISAATFASTQGGGASTVALTTATSTSLQPTVPPTSAPTLLPSADDTSTTLATTPVASPSTLTTAVSPTSSAGSGLSTPRTSTSSPYSTQHTQDTTAAVMPTSTTQDTAHSAAVVTTPAVGVDSHNVPTPSWERHPDASTATSSLTPEVGSGSRGGTGAPSKTAGIVGGIVLAVLLLCVAVRVYHRGVCSSRGMATTDGNKGLLTQHGGPSNTPTRDHLIPNAVYEHTLDDDIVYSSNEAVA